MSKKAKRRQGELGVFIGDIHAGHRAALTPPRWMTPEDDPQLSWFAALQREMWPHYESFIQEFHRPDWLIVNGDCREGRGGKNGGQELIRVSMLDQVQMALECIRPWHAKNIVLTMGTTYHVGSWTKSELMLAGRIKAETGANVWIGHHVWVDVGGVLFDVRHSPGGGGQLEHTRYTTLAKQRYFNEQWYLDNQRQPLADVYIRSHVHWSRILGDKDSAYISMTLPALQAAATDFGSAICNGTVNWGMTYFRCDGGQILDHGRRMPRLEFEIPEVLDVNATQCIEALHFLDPEEE